MEGDNLRVDRELFIPASIESVWNFLLDEGKMMNWLNAKEFVISIWDSGGFDFPYSFGGQECRIIGEVTILLEQEKYAFTWWEREPSGTEWFNCTTVTLDLKTKDEGTHITLSHTGFKYLPPEIWTEVHQRYSAYWVESGILERLSSLIVAEN